MRHKPQHRYLGVRAAKRAPKQPLEAALFALLHEQSSNKTNSVAQAWDIYQHEYKRETLEAALLSGMSPAEIQEALRLNADIVTAYAYLFFDTAVFESRLDEIDYAYTYDQSTFGRDLKKLAVDLGKDCLRIRLSNSAASDIPTTKITESIRKIAFLAINMVRTDRLNTELSNFAQRWATIGLRAADVKQDAPNNALESLRLALETANPVQPDIDPNQILH